MQVTTSRNRVFFKAFSWRILATLTTIAVAYLLTGRADLAMEIGAIEFFLKMFAYYYHERAWDKVQFGLEVKGLAAR